MAVLRVTRDDPEYLRLAAAEIEFWQRPHPFGLESLEAVESDGPIERYYNERFTGDRRVPWQDTIARSGTFRRGLVLGTSAMTVEARVLETNPDLDLTFVDISPGAVERRIEKLGPRFPGRVHGMVQDLNFIELEPASHDLIVSAAAMHHVTNLEHVAEQIDGALTAEGRFFLQDYVGEPRFQVTPEKARIFTLLHDRDLLRQKTPRRPGVRFKDASDLSPFCGVRSDDILGVFSSVLEPIQVRVAGALLVALFRAQPLHGEGREPPGVAERLLGWAERSFYALRNKRPPRKVLIPARFIDELSDVGDLLVEAGILLPGNAFGIYGKRRGRPS